MKLCRNTVLLTGVILLSACTAANTLTPEQLERENRVDAIVSGLLFSRGLDDRASYHVRKDGTVVIKFAEEAPAFEYSEVVSALRANPEIPAVRAEQSGREVCPLQ